MQSKLDIHLPLWDCDQHVGTMSDVLVIWQVFRSPWEAAIGGLLALPVGHPMGVVLDMGSMAPRANRGRRIPYQFGTHFSILWNVNPP